MKKLLMVLALVLLAVVQMEAQKTVKYTFTGRNAGPLGILIKEKPMTLKASQSIPKGVTVGAITGVTYEDGKDGSDEGSVNDVQLGAVMGIALLPQYVVKPQETATINFDGFRYEIKHIDWTFRTQIPLITSKAETWATDWKQTATNKTGWDFNDNSEEALNNQSSWQFAFHKHTFFDAPTDADNLKGLRTLNIECTSKMALHGVAMQDFYITYYEPEINFTPLSVKQLDADGSYGNVYTEPAHLGAFHINEVRFESLTPSLATVTFTGGHEAKVTANSEGTNGIAKVRADLISDGLVIASSIYQIRIGESPDWGWTQGLIYGSSAFLVGRIGFSLT